MGTGAAVIAAMEYCPEPRFSSWPDHESVLRRESMLLRPSGTGGRIEGLRIGVEAMISSRIWIASIVCPGSRSSCSE
jgi:hypothetical protein